MKKSLLWMFLLLLCLTVSAVDIGAPLKTDAVLEKAVSIIKRSVPKNADFEVILFFDASVPRATDLLDLMDILPDNLLFYKKTVRVTAIARNTQQQTTAVVAQYQPGYVSVFSDNEKGEVYKQFATDEILLPRILIIQDGKVRWKGAPVDSEGVLRRMIDGTYSMQKQVLIEMKHADLQHAIQAGLPEVISNTCERILKIDPADALAIQGKLYVLDGQKRPDLAEEFIANCCKNAPNDQKLRILHLHYLLLNNKTDEFKKELLSAANLFIDSNPPAFVQVLAFAVQNANFYILPINELRDLVNKADAKISSLPIRYRYMFVENASLVCYYGMDLDAAIQFIQKAKDSPRTQEILLFYRTMKLQQQKK